MNGSKKQNTNFLIQCWSLLLEGITPNPANFLPPPLKANLKKISPKALRVIKTNKAPIVLDKKFALKEKAYSDLDLETIKKRAELVRSSEKFCQNIQIINREAAEEKAQTKELFYHQNNQHTAKATMIKSMIRQ